MARRVHRAGDLFMRSALGTLSRLGRLHPKAQPGRHGVEVIRDVAYVDDGDDAHLLDVYRPVDRPGPCPAMLYVHGGGFRILSKDTHWMMGLVFASRGFVVFNINYRLAPAEPFPAAIEDACRACLWLLENAAGYGADPERLVLAGESAGANLVTSLAIADAWRRPEPFARELFEAAPRPRAVLPACGILQVSDWQRLNQVRRLNGLVRSRIEAVASGYLPDPDVPLEARALADPLVWLEEAPPPERDLPPFFALCGTRDVLVDDSRRLKVALDRRGVECEAPEYEGGVHAFHAFVWKALARQAWRDQLAFLERHL